MSENENEIKIYKEKKSFSFKKIVSIVILVAMFMGFGLGVGFQYGKSLNNQTAELNGPEENFIRAEVLNKLSLLDKPLEDRGTIEIVQEVAPSVVAITSTVDQSNFYQAYERENKGSGVIYEITPEKIFIITNHHVINAAKKVLIEFHDGTKAEADLIGSDSETDLALIAVETASLPTLNKMSLSEMLIGDSENLMLGEKVVALGNALGYGQSVTTGVVSALNRNLNLLQGDITLIQTDAAINPGNSGGALVNSKGELIGINTAKISDQNVEGVGFAIPIHEALPIVRAIEENGYISRPYLGIYGKDVDEDLSDLYQLPIGVVVMDLVPGSGAQEAGLVKGDVIVKLDEQLILTMEGLSSTLKNYEVDDVVKLTIIRADKRKVVEVTLKEKD